MQTPITRLLTKCWDLFDGVIFFLTQSYVKKIFLAGESIKEGLETARRLKDKHYGVTYHVMAEDLTDRHHVQMNVRTNIELLWLAHKQGLTGNLAVKLSALGGSLPLPNSEDQKPHTFNETESKRHLQYLLRAVRDIPDIEIEIDAEEYHTLTSTHRVVDELSLAYPGRLRMAVQMHVPDFYERAKECAYDEKKTRIVRGAGVYKDEAAEMATSEEDTNERALWLMRASIEHGQLPYLGTLTNARLFEHALNLLDQHHLSYDIFTLESLYGNIGRSLRKRACAKGVRVSVYMPIVVDWCIEAWKPYCTRRVPMMRKYFWNLFLSKVKSIFT